LILKNNNNKKKKKLWKEIESKELNMIKGKIIIQSDISQYNVQCVGIVSMRSLYNGDKIELGYNELGSF
jgi:hypothetical protein